ncbi:MAG: hypothetical protein ACFFEK_05910 [Candidatus Thorarchaeota archaeon]
MQQKLSRLPFIAFLSSLLLPYGIVIADTWIMTPIQIWLFPLWSYVNDFGIWLGLGILVPPFLPSFPILPSFSGLAWVIIGLYSSRVLQHVYDGQEDAGVLWQLALRLLVIQVIATIIVSFIAWYGWLIIVVPLPLHFVIVLYLTRLQIQRVESTQA